MAPLKAWKGKKYITQIIPTSHYRAIRFRGGELGQQAKLKVTVKPFTYCNSVSKRQRSTSSECSIFFCVTALGEDHVDAGLMEETVSCLSMDPWAEGGWRWGKKTKEWNGTEPKWRKYLSSSPPYWAWLPRGALTASPQENCNALAVEMAASSYEAFQEKSCNCLWPGLKHHT